MAKQEIEIRLSELTKLARLQCTNREAAAFFGIRLSTFNALLRNNEKARNTWEDGKEKGLISLRRKQWRLADDSPPMAIFLGKQYLSQREIVVSEVSGRDGGPVEFDASQLSQSERDALRTLIQNGRKPETAEE